MIDDLFVFMRYERDWWRLQFNNKTSVISVALQVFISYRMKSKSPYKFPICTEWNQSHLTSFHFVQNEIKITLQVSILYRMKSKSPYKFPFNTEWNQSHLTSFHCTEWNQSHLTSFHFVHNDLKVTLQFSILYIMNSKSPYKFQLCT